MHGEPVKYTARAIISMVHGPNQFVPKGNGFDNTFSYLNKHINDTCNDYIRYGLHCGIFHEFFCICISILKLCYQKVSEIYKINTYLTVYRTRGKITGSLFQHQRKTRQSLCELFLDRQRAPVIMVFDSERPDGESMWDRMEALLS